MPPTLGLKAPVFAPPPWLEGRDLCWDTVPSAMDSDGERSPPVAPVRVRRIDFNGQHQ